MAVDLRDVTLEAAADVQALVREVLQELAEPALIEKVRRVWSTMPDEMKAQFEQDAPDEFRAFMDLLK